MCRWSIENKQINNKPLNKIKLPSFINRRIFIYLVKFGGAFCILYYGTLAIEGLASPEGGLYSSFIDKHLDYVSWLRSSLTHATKLLLSFFDYTIDIVTPTHLTLRGGRGVNMGYDCLGYGVTSFWLAFVFANNGNWKRKLIWMLAGAIALWFINVLRVSILIVATNKGWDFPFGWDHHTWFNIASYILIFSLIFFYDKSGKN